MLVHRKEGLMRQQSLLFELREDAWVDRLWRSTDPEKRQRIVSILAEIGRAAISPRPREREASEQRSHES
jgi:hypothetical protein